MTKLFGIYYLTTQDGWEWFETDNVRIVDSELIINLPEEVKDYIQRAKDEQIPRGPVPILIRFGTSNN